jgi:hypothetical protein
MEETKYCVVLDGGKELWVNEGVLNRDKTS